jgi:hypothetical protein
VTRFDVELDDESPFGQWTVNPLPEGVSLGTSARRSRCGTGESFPVPPCRMWRVDGSSPRDSGAFFNAP